MPKQRKRVKSPKRLSVFIKTPAEMMHLAGTIAKALPAGTFIGLIGELGAGKTTFVKGFAAAQKIQKDTVAK